MSLQKLVAKHTAGIVDSLGKPIDRRIAPLVALLLENGVQTLGSCEGHDTHGLRYPWVDFHGDSYNRMNDLLIECFLGSYPTLKIWKFTGEYVNGEVEHHDRRFRLQPIDEEENPDMVWDALHQLEVFLAKPLGISALDIIVYRS